MQLGKKQLLTVVKIVDFGIYLADPDDPEDRVLLPKKQVRAGVRPGDQMEVFLYKDSRDRPIATTAEPLLTLGDVGRLKVKEVSRIGAFLDWGLEKDLFLPFRQQTRKVRAGEECLVALYIDKSGRLCATMNVYEYLRTDSPYGPDDHVTGTVYQISENFGAFVAVDDLYSGLVPKKEFYDQAKIGDRVEARVTGVKADGKLDLSLREKTYLQIDEDAEQVMKAIEEFGGVLPFSDKASPEVIKRELSMSKNAFKRAVGRLLKEGRVEITDKSIRKR
ncbi:RNA-binding protein [Lachnoclostridium sp. An196]|uniref:CvfB family protein n=1 Tax=Lachnoclostridium sp. An196 TaxID=1965583 RepID=UPI000B3A70CE|nr:S1-like domain-containing RNA-binding protein [Lachnoclostridium sp. An196]OUP21516.1 RNA-binding protein [Lachnoclostridium sp. An196]HIS07649.1 S1 RNA-binding domain-containing protein [Candidatus Choladocola avistercoris]